MSPPSDAERRRSDTLTFAVLLLAALVCTLLPLPWRLAGIAFAGWGGFLGTRLLGRIAAASRAGQPVSGHLGVAVGLGACLVVVVQLGTQAALLPAELDRQECLAGAGTVTAQQACEEEFAERLPLRR